MIGKCERCDTLTELVPGTSLCPSCARPRPSVIKKCEGCGVTFADNTYRHNKSFCSRSCREKHRGARYGYIPVHIRAMRNAEDASKSEMHGRLARRDAEYAAVAAPVKVIVRNGVRTEIRGRLVVGARSVGRVKY